MDWACIMNAYQKLNKRTALAGRPGGRTEVDRPKTAKEKKKKRKKGLIPEKSHAKCLGKDERQTIIVKKKKIKNFEQRI